MPQALQNRLLNYGLAILTVAIATGITLLLYPYLEPVNMAFFFAAVAFSAWRGGIGAGVTATVLSVLSIAYFFLPPLRSLEIRPSGLIPLSIFTLVALCISSLSAELKMSKRRTEISLKAQLEAEKGRWQLMEDLEAKQGQLEAILQQMPAAVVAAQAPSGRLLFMNQQVQQILRGSVPMADAIEDYLIQYLAFHPDGRLYSPSETPLARSLRSGEVVVDEEISILCGDGERRSILVSAAPVRDAIGRVISAVAVFYEISQQKQTEVALQAAKQQAQRRAYDAEEAERILQLLMENVPEGITIVGKPPDFPIVASSKFAEVLTGKSSDSLVGIPSDFYDRAYGLLRADGTRPALQQTPLYRATRDGETVSNEEWLLQRSDGSQVTVLVHTAPICTADGEIDGAISCWRDISARKQALEALRQSESRFQHLVANVPGMIYQYAMAIDGSNKYTYVSPQSREIYEHEPEDLRSDFVWKMIHPDDRLLVQTAIQESAERGTDFDSQFRVLLPSGRLKWLHSRSKPSPQTDGSILWDGLITDITDRKKVELELAQANERFELAAAAVNSLIYEVDLQSLQVKRTQGLKRLLGYSLEEAEPTLDWWADRIHPDDRCPSPEYRQRLATLTDHHQYEYRVCHKDGHYLWVRDYGIIVRDPMGQPVRIVGSTTQIATEIADRQ